MQRDGSPDDGSVHDSSGEMQSQNAYPFLQDDEETATPPRAEKEGKENTKGGKKEKKRKRTPEEKAASAEAKKAKRLVKQGAVEKMITELKEMGREFSQLHEDFREGAKAHEAERAEEAKKAKELRDAVEEAKAKFESLQERSRKLDHEISHSLRVFTEKTGMVSSPHLSARGM